MRTVVIGGMGFIGSNLVDQLIEDGHEVVVIDDLSTGKIENGNEKAEFKSINISHMGVFSNIFEGVDWIFHLAAKTSVQESIEDPFPYNAVNVTGLLNVLTLAKDAGVKKFIFSSSSSVYGDGSYIPTDEKHPLNPMNPYGAQKLIGETYCKQFYRTYGLRSTCLRYFNVYGNRQHSQGSYAPVIGKFMEQKNNGLPMTINGDGRQRRDFVHVDDVVAANILAATTDIKAASRATCFNIGSGKNYSVNQIADMIGGDRVNNIEPILEARETLADISKAKHLLNWAPEVSLEDWIVK
jgi:nucleoside-diphosphate-sugar epimerase